MTRLCAILLVLSAATAFVLAQPEPTPISNAREREVLSLNGAWQILVDPIDAGTFDYLSRPRNPGYWGDFTPESPRQLIEHSFVDTETLEVPGDWNSQLDELFFYEGTVWYRRAFSPPPAAEGARRFLRFGAANRRATVWLNGNELGTHEVGFTPFVFEVTDTLLPGENIVVVRVDNRRRSDDVPGLLTDWWNYGGLTREVSLLETPETFVREWSVVLEDDEIRGWVRVDGPSRARRSVSVSLPDADLDETARTNAEGIARFTLPATSLDRWSPEEPNLYDLRFALNKDGDTATDRVGFRTIETDGGDILLNGERVFLKGICIHEEAPTRAGRAWSEEDARTLLGWAKELNCNYVRLAHYPHSETMLRVADELGLMVWAEVPVYWVIDYESEHTMRLAETHMREMIERDRNRASVIIWSVGNETGDDPERTAFRLALGRKVKEWDPTRLLSAACFAHFEQRDDGSGVVRVVVDDPFGELADVVAINQYVGWYWGEPEDLLGAKLKLVYEKPFLISEFGVGVRQGLRGSPDAVWTEEFGVRLYTATLDWLESLKELDGLSPWILRDFRSPRRPLYGVQDWYNRKGLLSERGIKKDVFGLLQRRYAEWPAP